MSPRPTLSPRTLIAEAAIALAVCAGAYLLLVDPAEAERRTLAQQAGAPSPPQTDGDTAGLVKSLAEIRAFVHNVGRNSALSLDESTIVSRYMKEAGRCGVTIESVLPSSARSHPGLASAKPQAGKPTDRITGFSLRVTGEYQPVTTFISRLQELGGYTLVQGVQLAPDRSPGSALVQASIETAHVAMDLRGLASVMPKSEAPQ